MAVLDLLCLAPELRLDAAGLKQLLTFAFASGVPSSAFAQLFESAKLPATTWDPKAFARELFLPELIARCFPVRIGEREHAIDAVHLARVLSHPPADPTVTRFRREVLAALAVSSAARAELEKIYTSLCHFRALLEAPPVTRRLGSNRRRLEILGALKATIDAMAESFADEGGGLLRLREFAAEVQTRPGYLRLRDLLDYHEHLSTLDVRVRVGLDGRVRGLDLLAVRENEDNSFHTSPLRRFFAKLGALLRGYRFSEEEVLTRLTDRVFEGLEDEQVQLFQLIGDLEFYLAALGFRDLARRSGLSVCLPELGAPEDATASERKLVELFNPHLLAQPGRVVACDLSAATREGTVIVTGPNSGGKTRFLQAVAIAQMLGQSGFFVPAREATLARAPGLFVSLIEETTADHVEGRLGTELLRIRWLFERVHVGSMIVLDELCSGTNPSEGEEIFELVLTLLAELEPQAFITTHFLTLAARIAERPPVDGVSFLQVELDTRQYPTYRFVPGVATTSLAKRTAARLGVTRDELMRLVDASKQRRG